jgi:nucleoside-diphosphate-sugar epimerase
MIQTALVTGISGFVGSHLGKSLIEKSWDVHGIVLPGIDTSELREAMPAARFHEYDGTTETVSRIVKECRPTVVFHLASLFISDHVEKDIFPLISSNVLLGTQLAEAMKINGCRRLVNTGTSWQHFENAGYRPVNLYSATKQAFEDILQYYVESGALSVINLKLFDTYGPNDKRPKLFSILKEAGLSRKPLKMSPGKQLIDLVHIDDVVDAFLLAAELSGRKGATRMDSYAVSSGHPLELKELVVLVEKAFGRSIPVLWGERPYRLREVMVPWNTGNPPPGWKPQIPLEKGLAEITRGWTPAVAAT